MKRTKQAQIDLKLPGWAGWTRHGSCWTRQFESYTVNVRALSGGFEHLWEWNANRDHGHHEDAEGTTGTPERARELGELVGALLAPCGPECQVCAAKAVP